MTTRRVLFLPYQAAMWDSLESVWAAAMADSSCEVRVMALPFDTFDEVGRPVRHAPEPLPPNVPTTPWDPAVLRGWADVTYIHNPYDQHNQVTRVDPAAFSDALGRTAGRVVYIPYFVTNGWLPEGHRWLPAYENVDALVVSTGVALGMLDPGVQEKAHALGSPKVDAIVKACRERAAHAADSSPRIAALVNLSIESLLVHGDGLTRWAHRLFDTAVADGGVELLWRPHPLLLATAESMRPELVKPLQDLNVRASKSDVIRVATEEPLAAVIAQSDCYVGDGSSSLVPLYGVSGRPMMFFSDRVGLGGLGQDWSRPFVAEWWIEDEVVWFTDQRLNALCQADPASGRCQVVQFLEGRRLVDRPRGRVRRVGETLVVAPRHAPDVAVYLPHGGPSHSIPVGEGETIPFSDMVGWRDKVVLTPGQHPHLVVVNPVLGEVSTWQNWLPPHAEAHSVNVDRFWVNAAILLADRHLICASGRSFELFFVDLEARTTRVLKIAEGAGGFSSLCFSDGHLTMTLVNRPGFITVRIKGGVPALIDDPGPGEGHPNAYSRLLPWGAGVLAVPHQAENGVEIRPAAGAAGAVPIEALGLLRGAVPGATEGRSSAASIVSGDIAIHDLLDGALVRRGEQGRIRRVPLRWDPALRPSRRGVAEGFFSMEEAMYVGVREDGLDVTPKSFFSYVRSGVHDEGQQRRDYSTVVGPVDGKVGERIHRTFLG